jgi:undecaprenyl-diphosphatase
VVQRRTNRHDNVSRQRNSAQERGYLVNAFDVTIIHFFNAFACRSAMLDQAMSTRNVFVVGGVPMAFFWYAWILYGSADSEKRQVLVAGIVDSVFALFVARVLAFSLPFRPRPFNNPALHFHLPIGVDPTAFIHWSSFPSDRATLFFCVAAILWIVSRWLGTLAICYAFSAICLPAIYSGVHYPTDIIAGAALGIGVACLCKSAKFTAFVARPALSWLNTNPGLFHSVLFLWTFEIAELFTSVRHLVFYALRYAKLMT